jgi:hypothetical protein
MAGQRVVRVSPKVLANLLGLPEDAVLEGASTHLFFDTGDVALRFHSGQWADRVPGDVIPEIRVEKGAVRILPPGFTLTPEHTDCGFVDPPATPDDTPHIIIGD